MHPYLKVDCVRAGAKELDSQERSHLHERSRMHSFLVLRMHLFLCVRLAAYFREFYLLLISDFLQGNLVTRKAFLQKYGIGTFARMLI